MHACVCWVGRAFVLVDGEEGQVEKDKEGGSRTSHFGNGEQKMTNKTFICTPGV